MSDNDYKGKDLVEVVSVCLVKLLARSLRFGPSPDDIQFVAEVFTEDFVRAGKTKHLRIAEAFDYIGGNDRDWPQPIRVMEVMSMLAKQKSMEAPALPLPEVNPEVAAANIKKIRAMCAEVIDNGQPKKEIKRKKHMDSKFGTLPLTDDQLIEARAVFQKANVEGAPKGHALRVHNQFIEKCLKANLAGKEKAQEDDK